MFSFETLTMFFYWFHRAGCILLILLLVVIALMLWRWRVHRDPLPPRARTVFNRTFHRKRNEENEIYSGRSNEMQNRRHTVIESLFSRFFKSHDAICAEKLHSTVADKHASYRKQIARPLLQFIFRLVNLFVIILLYSIALTRKLIGQAAVVCSRRLDWNEYVLCVA